MNRKLTVVIITLIIILIGGYYYEQENTRSQQKGLYLKGPLSNSNIERANFTTAVNEGPTTNEIELNRQLEELNEQLINARAELKVTQDKLIISTSKNTILEKDLQDSRDTLETLQKALERISESSTK